MNRTKFCKILLRLEWLRVGWPLEPGECDIFVILTAGSKTFTDKVSNNDQLLKVESHTYVVSRFRAFFEHQKLRSSVFLSSYLEYALVHILRELSRWYLHPFSMWIWDFQIVYFKHSLLFWRRIKEKLRSQWVGRSYFDLQQAQEADLKEDSSCSLFRKS